MEHYNATGNDDPLIVLSGIADVLSKIVYEDDVQIKEAHYVEYWDEKDHYIVNLEFMESSGILPATEPIRKGKEWPQRISRLNYKYVG